MNAKPRWIKRAIETARDDKTPLPFHRGEKATDRVHFLKKAANA